MSFASKPNGTVEVVTCSGRLDAAVAPEIRQHLDQLIQKGRHRLILDLAEVSFVDSSGLAVVINALQNTRALGGDVALLKPGLEVRSILELTRLNSILHVYQDETAAISALGSS